MNFYKEKTALVTGGAGFIGSHVVEHVLARGGRAIVVDNLSTGAISNVASFGNRVEFIRGSAADEALAAEVVCRSDCVFHLAASVGNRVVSRKPLEAIENNLRGASSVLAACAKYNKPILIASSSEVYGRSPDMPFTEDADLVLGKSTSPRWLYAVAKLANEFEAMAYHRQTGLHVVVARFFNVAGPRQSFRFGMVLPRFVRQALLGEPITVYGDGSQVRCYCHASTLADGVLDLLAEPRADGEIVNLGSDVPITVLELANKVKDVTGSSSKVITQPYDAIYGKDYDEMVKRHPDVSKAERLIGFRSTIPLERIIADVADWMRANWAEMSSEHDY